MKPTLMLLSLVLSIGASGAGEAPTMELFDPASPEAAAAFVVVNDSVMGGVSSSRVTVEKGALVFSGTVRLENNGGFASMRARTGTLDLSDYTGIELVVRGDGQRYKLNLRDDGRFDGVVHRVDFETRAGEEITLRLPFEDFAPSWRGRQLSDVAPLDTSRIRQLGILISDKQVGDFRLEVLAVRVYR